MTRKYRPRLFSPWLEDAIAMIGLLLICAAIIFFGWVYGP